MKNKRLFAVSIPCFLFSAFTIIPLVGTFISFVMAIKLILDEEASRSLKFVYLMIWALGVICFSWLYVESFYQEKNTLILNIVTGAIWLVIGLATLFTRREIKETEEL